MKRIRTMRKESGVYEVTPQDATEILDRPGNRNRPLTLSAVNRYRRRMAEGKWGLGEPLLLSPKGVLLDGQHRLHAVCDYGKPVVFVIVYEEFDFLKIGQIKPRKSPDALDLAFGGVKNRHGVAATVTLCMLHERALRREASMYAQTNAARDNWKDIDNAEAVNWVRRNRGVVELYARAQSLGTRGGGPALISLSPAAACWFLAGQLSDEADSWFEGLLSGASLNQGDIRLLLRQTMQNRISTPSQVKPFGVELMHWISKAWHVRHETHRRMFVVRSTEDFPFFR